jgi:hypothetical protein
MVFERTLERLKTLSLLLKNGYISDNEDSVCMSTANFLTIFKTR